MSEPLRVLLVEDSENDALLLLRELKRTGFEPDYQRVQSADGVSEALTARSWDIVLSDYQMPQFTGLDALKLVVDSGLDLPVIIISGTIGEDLAVEAMKAGAHDYLMKGKLARLGPAVRRELGEAEGRRQRRKAERDRFAAERRIEQLNRMLHAIRRVNQLIVRERDPQRLIQRACDLLIETQHYAGVWISLTDASVLPDATAVAGWGEGLEVIRERFRQGVRPARCQLGQRRLKALVIDDPVADCEGCALALAVPNRRALVVPLKHGDLAYGHLCAAILKSHQVDVEELSLVDEVAADLAYALHSIGVEHARQEAEAQVGHQAWLLENVTDAIVSTDMDFVIQSWNKAAETLYGWSADEVLGRPLAEIVTPEYLSDSRERVLLAFSETGHWEGEVVHRCKDGSVISVLGAVTQLRDGDGRPVGAVSAYRDISDRKRAEATLRQSEERFRGIFEGVRDGILVVDPATKQCLMGNQAICDMLGYQHDELLSMQMGALHPAEELSQVLEAFDRQVRSEEPLATNISVKRQDGSVFQADVNARLLELEGQPRLMGCFRDVTERERMRAQLAQADRMASVGMLAAGVAHEINNPLTYVLYNLQNLCDDLPGLADALGQLQRAMGAEQTAALLGEAGAVVAADRLTDILAQAADAAQGAGRIRDIVKDLRTFSHVDEDRVVAVSVNDTIESAINLAFNEIKYRARLNKDYGQLPDLMANDGKLAQVFLNLLVNAAHAIDEGDQQHNEIRVRTWVDGDQVVAEVKDTGQGIRPEHLSRLFEPFFTTKDVGIGSGLGLAICRNIIVGLGGTIEVSSEVGKGSIFSVLLPIAPQERPSQAVIEAAEPAPVSTFRARVLVVDDEPLVGEAMKRILRHEHHVEVVTSGAAAKRVLAEDGDFDAVICDLIMPEVTGMDLHEWMVEHCPEVAERVIFVSGGAFTPRASEFLGRVSNRKLEKPVEPKRIKAVLRQLIDQNHLGQ